MSHTVVPDIRSDPQAWFRFFDKSRSGALEKNECVDAFAQTFTSCDHSTLAAVVDNLWPLFDPDGSGSITMQEFTAPNGLCETMVAQMPAPSQPSGEVHVRCGNCGTVLAVNASHGICII